MQPKPGVSGLWLHDSSMVDAVCVGLSSRAVLLPVSCSPAWGLLILLLLQLWLLAALLWSYVYEAVQETRQKASLWKARPTNTCVVFEPLRTAVAMTHRITQALPSCPAIGTRLCLRAPRVPQAWHRSILRSPEDGPLPVGCQILAYSLDFLMRALPSVPDPAAGNPLLVCWTA